MARQIIHSLPSPSTSARKAVLTHCWTFCHLFSITTSATIGCYFPCSAASSKTQFTPFKVHRRTDLLDILVQCAEVLSLFSVMDVQLIVNQRREKKGTTHTTMMLTSPVLDWEGGILQRGDNLSSVMATLNRSACNVNCIKVE